MSAQTDPWAKAPVYMADVFDEGNIRVRVEEDIRAARAEVERQHAAQVAAKDAEIVQLRAQVQQQAEAINSFWTEVARSYDIEPREFFEVETSLNGFASPIAMAVHHMWKRDLKERDGQTIIGKVQHDSLVADRDAAQAEAARLREALEVFVVLLDGQTEPLHPLSWQVELAQARAALASTDDGK